MQVISFADRENRSASPNHGCQKQVIKPDLLEQGFALVRREKLEVTDDVSIVEALGEAVKVTKGSYTNLKVVPGAQDTRI